MNKRPCKLRITSNISTIIASITIVVSCTTYFAQASARTDAIGARDDARANLLNVRMDYLAAQIADVKQTQADYNQKIDKIYDIVRSNK